MSSGWESNTKYILNRASKPWGGEGGGRVLKHREEIPQYPTLCIKHSLETDESIATKWNENGVHITGVVLFTSLCT